MKVLLELRGAPFFLAHGGVAIQIQQTFSALQAVGIEMEYQRWWDESQRADIIHCFGRAHSAHIRFAREKSMRYVQSELLTGQGSRSNLRLNFEGIRNRILNRYAPHQIREASGWISYQLADAAIALTSWEAKLMEQLYMAPPDRIRVVPNGVEKEFFENADTLKSGKADREDYLVCTATITERKRVVELAEAAILAQTPVWIIGKPYFESDPYHQRFLALHRAHPQIVRFEGPISDRSRLAEIYRQARGFVLLSTMESLSLSALEAAATECPLLLSDLPWARCTFGDKASYCPITNHSATTAAALQKFHQAAPTHPIPDRPKTWIEVAQQLKGIYEEILRK